jgi:regulator of protease activity HflC (stomatin/prohibitin superfamily)
VSTVTLKSLPQYPKGVVRILLIVIAVIFLLSQTLVFVPAGYVGVVYDRGKGVLDRPMGEGLNIAIPLWQSVTFMSTRLQEYTMSAVKDEGAMRTDDSLDAPTNDGQQVKIDATVIFRINADHASEVYKTIGLDYIEKIIRPFTRSQIRMVISRYTAPAIYSEKRQEAESVMTDELSKLVADKNIIIDKVLLRAVYFSPEYARAIEEKAVAEQRIKQAEFEVQETQRRAEAKIEEAKGLAEAQALQRSNLTAEFLQLEAIKKWDGKLPQYVGSTSLPFIGIPTQ